MGKTIETKEDTLQESGQASGVGDEGNTSDTEAKTYTEEEKVKAVSDALAKAGRTAKELTSKEADLNSRQEAINVKQTEMAEWERTKDEAEYEAVKGDPDRLKRYQEGKSYKDKLTDLTKDRADFDREKADHEAELTSAREAVLETKIFEIAAEEKVNPKDIKDKMGELNLTTPEQAKTVAQMLSGKKPEATDTKMKLDSMKTSGKGKDWHELSPDEKIQRGTAS